MTLFNIKIYLFNLNTFIFFLKKVFTSYDPTNLLKHRQNYCILYSKNNKIYAGLIQTFYKIQESYYAVVKRLNKSHDLVSDLDFENELNNFSVICSLDDELNIINVNEIKNKCVLLKKDDREYFISICNQINEHD